MLKDYCVMRRDVVYSGRNVPTFWRKQPPRSTGRCRKNLKSQDFYHLSIIFCRKADGNWKTQL